MKKVNKFRVFLGWKIFKIALLVLPKEHSKIVCDIFKNFGKAFKENRETGKPVFLQIDFK